MKRVVAPLSAAIVAACHLPTPVARPLADHCSLTASWQSGRIEFATDIADSGEVIKPRSKPTFELRSTIPFTVSPSPRLESVRDPISGCVFTPAPERNQIVVSDVANGRTIGSFAISGGALPSALAIDAEARLLFVANGASPSILVVDLDKAQVMSVYTTNAIIVRQVVDSGWHRLYGQSADGTVWAYDLRRSRLFLTAEPNQRGLPGIGVDARTHDVLALAGTTHSGTVLVLKPLPPPAPRCVFHHSNPGSPCWARYAITR